MPRNKILTFLFSLIPGAGHMYYGLYRQGIQLMLMFIGVLGMAEFFNLDMLLLILPVICFFSFFHINNLSKMPPEEFATYKDHLFTLEALIPESVGFSSTKFKYSPSIALLLLCFGIFLLLRNVVTILSPLLPRPIDEFLYAITWHSPQVFVSIVIIGIAVQMIKNKKKELELELNNEKQLEVKQDI